MSARTSKSLKAKDFFARHPVFTHAEFVDAHTRGGRSRHTSDALLAQHVASGRLVRVRRGVYATVERGQDPRTATPDPYLVASKLRPDAVVAHHAALALHGKAYSVWTRYHYLTAERGRPFRFGGSEFVPVQAPAPVRELPDFGGGVESVPHAGGRVRAATLERCVADLMNAPEHGGGWEEIFRSLEMIEYLDLQEVVRLTLLLDSAATAARVGFFLEQHRELWMVEERHLEPLLDRAPRQARYFGPGREPGRLVPRWNLIVQQGVLERSWEEPS